MSTFMVTLDSLLTRRTMLELARIPKYLRFVVRYPEWKDLDALDKLEDEPQPDEFCIAARLESKSSLHVDGGQPRWYRTAIYKACPVQPPQDIMRDRAKWQAWCLNQIASEPQEINT